MSEYAGTQSAQCAIHVDQQARSICARCGNFMCDTCTEGATYEACPTCRAVTGADAFPYDRSNYDLSGVLSFAWGHFKREWLMLSVAMLIFFVALVGIGLVSSILQGIGQAIDPGVGIALAVPGQVIQTVVQWVLTAGLGLVFWEVFRGRSVDVGQLFKPFARFGTFVVAMLLYVGLVLAVLTVVGVPAGIAWFIGGEEAALIVGVIAGVLMLIPLIWVGLPLMYLPYEVAIGGETSALQAVKNTLHIAQGNRLSILGYTFVSGAITMLGVFACCVGIVPAMALGQMVTFGLYLALRNGSGLPPSRSL